MPVINIKDTDTKAFNWIYRSGGDISIYPPAVALIDGTYYRLNAFDIDTEDFFLIDATEPSTAINISISHYNGVANPVEAANIYNICSAFGINPSSFLEPFGYKGKKSFEILSDLSSSSETLKSYCAEKNLSIKVLGIYFKLRNGIRNAVDEYIRQSSPSVSNFRNVVTTLFDMNPDTFCYSAENMQKLTGEKAVVKNDFMTAFNEFTKEIEAEVSGIDGFETPGAKLTIKGTSADEILDRINKLGKQKEELEKLFGFLQDNDIC